jgi:molybdopterin-guanine dinucleotide biosynthesis protein A
MVTAVKGEGGVGGYILVGGGSTRFGRDKALVEIGGRPMLARMIELMQSAAGKVKLVALLGKYHGYDVEIVADQWPGEGPLGGIITALEDAAKSSRNGDWNLMVSCDMPFSTNDWLKFMYGRAAESKAQVVLPHSASGPEPLCACYRTNAAVALRAAFESGVRKVTEGLKHVSTEVLDEKDWKRFDSAGRLFWNMNTLADYEEARRFLDAGER